MYYANRIDDEKWLEKLHVDNTGTIVPKNKKKNVELKHTRSSRTETEPRHSGKSESWIDKTDLLELTAPFAELQG